MRKNVIDRFSARPQLTIGRGKTYNSTNFLCASAAVLCLMLPTGAHAQGEKWATGDWGGLRNELEAQGVSLGVTYMSQMARNLSGGYNTQSKTEYIDQISVLGKVDLDKMFGISNASIDMLLVDRNHSDQSLSVNRINDPRTSSLNVAQESSGGGSVWRLGLLAYKQSFFDNTLTVRAGRINKVWDFDNALPCDFQSLNLCGGKSATNLIWYNWRVSSWGATVKYNLTPQLALKTGVYEQNPKSLENDQGFSFSTKGKRGVIIPAEVEWHPSLFPGKADTSLPGTLLVGLDYSTANANDLYYNEDGTAKALGGTAKVHDNQIHYYFAMEQQVTNPDGKNTKRGARVFLTGGYNDARTATQQQAYSTGVRYYGPFASRPDDVIAMGVDAKIINKYYVKNSKLRHDLSGIEDYDNPSYVPVPGNQYSTELYYRAQITPWFSLQPSVNYWVHPSGLNELKNAFFVGLKTSITF